jgi:hypothetical protein
MILLTFLHIHGYEISVRYIYRKGLTKNDIVFGRHREILQ